MNATAIHFLPEYWLSILNWRKPWKSAYTSLLQVSALMDEVIIPVCNQVPDYVLGQGFWVRRQHILALAVCAFPGVLNPEYVSYKAFRPIGYLLQLD